MSAMKEAPPSGVHVPVLTFHLRDDAARYVDPQR
jgi:hypothetical protein